MLTEENPSTAVGTDPKVTVVIPCYKQSHYLVECLSSITAQTYPHWRAIVVDDASPDSPEIYRVVKEIDDSRIRVVSHDRNRGLAASRNTGIRESETELVYPLDSDDKIEPDCLESLVPVLLADEALDCAFPNVRRFGRMNEVTEFHGPPPGEKLVRIVDTLPGAGTLMRKKFWERVGEYDEGETLRLGREDFEFYVRAFRKGCNAAHVDKPLYLYRISHSSMTIACALRDNEVYDYIYNKHREVFDSAGAGNAFLSFGYDSVALAAHMKGQRGRALQHAVKAWRLQPNLNRLRAIGRSVFAPNTFEVLRTGEVRRRLPFVGYPLNGRERYRPFFIIGVARSGNTLFRRTLTSHSQLHIPPETFVLGACIQKFRKLGRKLSWPDLVSLVMAEFEFHPEFHTFETWLGPLVDRLKGAARKDRNLAFLIDCFYRYHAEQHGQECVRWGDKTPMNSLDDDLVRNLPPRKLGHGVPHTLERLLRVFPDAQFIHIYRDGCDVVRSHLSGGFMSSMQEAAERWLHVIRQSRNFVRKHPERSFEVRYEDLITKPEATLRGVCGFLEVDFEPAMVSSEKSATALGDVPEWYWHQQVAAPINPANTGKGRVYFSESERATLEEIIGSELESLGYAPPTAELPKTEPGS